MAARRRPVTQSAPKHSRAKNARQARARVLRAELLEPRMVLSAPALAPIQNVTVNAGAPLMIALNGVDTANAHLTFTASSSNPALLSSTLMPSSNRDIKMIVQGYGEMDFQLFDNYVPGMTNRIVKLIEDGFYNHGTTASDPMTIHRLALPQKSDGTVDTSASPFCIQGGDPKGNGTGGSGISFDDAYNTDLRYTSEGVLAMAKGTDPKTGFPTDTNDSQFFIMTKDMRQFDFNYAIFGYLTKGMGVLNAIRDAPRISATSDAPLNKIVISSVSEYTDYQNGVLMLKAPVGASGTADVTVTVNNGTESSQQVIHVTIQADTNTADPYLDTVPDIYTTTGATTSFTVPSVVVGDVTPTYGAYSNNWQQLQVNVGTADGTGVITTSGGLVGVSSIVVGVHGGSSGRWDTQQVPVFISPTAPTSVVLVGGNKTWRNNTPGKELQFTVRGVLSGSDVSVYADGTLIGHATANADSVTITSNGAMTLADGIHTITTQQTLKGQPYSVGNRTGFKDLASATSAPLSIQVAEFMPFAPLIQSISIPSAGVQGRSLLVSSQFTDANPRDRHSVQIDWGDGKKAPATATENSGNGSISAQHVYASGGVYSLVVTVTDDTDLSASTKGTAIISGIGIHDGVLQIVGTQQRDDVKVSSDHGQIRVQVSGSSGRSSQSFQAAQVRRVEVFLLGGNDNAAVNLSGAIPVLVDGGPGNDSIDVEHAACVLLGGDGNDSLNSSGRAVLVGGNGRDLLLGSSERIAIGGTTAYSGDSSAQTMEHRLALMAMLNEWTTPKSLAERMQNLTDGNGATPRQNDDYFLQLGVTVFNDTAHDRVRGWKAWGRRSAVVI